MKRILCIATVVTAGLALGACGSDDSPSSAGRPASPGAAPVLRAPALFSVERRRGDAAIGETLTVGRDGSAVIVRAGGGGGRRTEHCRLGAPLLSKLRHEAPSLPAPAPPKMRDVQDPAIYLVTRDGRHAVFVDGAIPSTLKPFLDHVTGVLSGRWGACVNETEQRP
jgi:hypothetical protein